MTQVWETQDLPFLRALVQLEEDDGHPLPMPGQVAERAGLPGEIALRLVERLNEGGFLRATIRRNGAGRIWTATDQQPDAPWR